MLKDRERLLGLALQLTLGAMMLELAATYSFGLFPILLLAVAALFFVVAIDRYGLEGAKLMRELWARFGGYWLIPVLLGLYILLDLAGLFYSQAPIHGFYKYKVVALMLFLCLCLLLYTDSMERLRGLLRAMGLASAFIAAFTVLNYFAGILPMPYTLRLTLRTDYNVFASTILLGFLCTLYLFLTGERGAVHYLLFALNTGLTLMVLYLSSSRRVFMMFPPILVFWLFLILFRQKNWRGLLCTMAAVLAAGALFWSMTAGMRIIMQTQYEQNGAQTEIGGGGGGGGESTAEERYETVGESGMWAKRKLIWGIAWDAYTNYTLPQKLIGKGFAYDILLYDEVQNEELAREYAHLEGQKGMLSAHNFVLADLISGGILKAAAGVLLVLGAVWVCVALLLHSFSAAALYGNALVVVVVNNLISNRYGLLYDKFFYLFLLFLLLHLRLQLAGKRRLL